MHAAGANRMRQLPSASTSPTGPQATITKSCTLALNVASTQKKTPGSCPSEMQPPPPSAPR
eukprot:8504677-Alexandrium_andersonii.AAC.1